MNHTPEPRHSAHDSIYRAVTTDPAPTGPSPSERPTAAHSDRPDPDGWHRRGIPARPFRVLDLFCGAGGAAMGYHQAWPDAEIVGVDINPQPRYPFTFVQADATTYPLDGFDFVHASPPCQDHSVLKHATKGDHGTGWMLEHAVRRLMASGLPFVVENVEGAEMPGYAFHVTLCGSMFGLQVQRHRRFAVSQVVMVPPCQHATQRRLGPIVDVTGHGMQGREVKRRKALGLPLDTHEDRKAAMGIDWMTRDGMAQAIPPAYTRFLAEQIRPTTPTAPRQETEGRSLNAPTKDVFTPQRTDTEGAHGG